MKATTIRAFLLLALGTPSSAIAATTPIGLVISNGRFEIDHLPAWSDATIFDASVIQTSAAASHLQLKDGTRVRLGADSRAQIFQQRALLQKGIGELEGSTGYELGARGLKIFAGEANAVARVLLEGERKVLVAALKGSVRVTNGRGVLVAKLEEGRTLSFDPQPGDSSMFTQASGCLSRRAGKLIVVDETTGVTLELQGRALEKNLGSLIEIAGDVSRVPPTFAGASQLIQVTKVQKLAAGACEATKAHAPNLVYTASAAKRPPMLAQAASQRPALALTKLNIHVIEGEGAVNNIRLRTVREPIVEVVDEERRPVPGAAVVFTLPEQGAGGTFANGLKQLSVLTDQQGRAVATGFTPNDVPGKFEINVNASHEGQVAQATITQSNILGAAAGAVGLGVAAKVAIIGGVAAGGTVVGLAAAGALPGQGESPPNTSQ